jgi:hypothetical protein
MNKAPNMTTTNQFDSSTTSRQLSTNNKKNRVLSTIALTMILMAESLLIGRLFMTVIVEYLTPLFFAFTFILLIIHCLFTIQNLCLKTFLSFCFVVELLGAIAVFLNIPQLIPQVSQYFLWKSHVFPITLIMSASCAIITLFKPCCILCATKQPLKIKSFDSNQKISFDSQIKRYVSTEN